MNTRFAPFPWVVSNKEIKCTDHARYYTVANVHNELFTEECNQANTNLLAAAPDLYEALKEANIMLNTHFGISDNDEAGNLTHDKIRAALAKAENR